MRRRTSTAGRSTAQLLADFGHQPPTITQAAEPPREGRLFGPAPARGRARRDAGWSPSAAPVSVWRMTSDQAPVLWPLIAAPALPPTGAQIGIDLLSGGSFHADPVGWVLDDQLSVANPNVFVFGKPGRGKSGTVKAFCLRMIDFGYRVLVLGDVKDEYEPLCRALGVPPIAIGHGLPGRINPLDPGPLADGWNQLPRAEALRRTQLIFARWLTLIRGLVGSQHIGTRRVPFGPSDEAVTKTALTHLVGHRDGASRLAQVTIPQLWRALDQPSDELVAECRYADTRQFLDATRLLRDALGQLVTGTLAGLFDAPTTIDIDWTAPIQTLSLSRLEALGEEPVAIALTCLNSWGRGMRELAPPGELRTVVRDESWRQLRLGVDAVKAFDADLRLSRSSGDIQLAVCHKPSDLLSAGDAGSQATAIAKDLLHLADTHVLHGQDAAVADELDQLLGLGPIQRNLITGWAMQGRGRALWRVGDRDYKVQTVLHPIEAQLANTNLQLSGRS